MRLRITKERAAELGLILCADDCVNCDCCFECFETDDKATIEGVIEDGYECPGLDEDRLREDMTKDEYDAYRHGGLEIES